MTRTRVIGPVIGGAGATAVLAVVLGNQWVFDALARHDAFGDAKIGPLVAYATFPRWRVTPVHAATLVPADLPTVLLLALVALLAVLAVRAPEPRRAGLGVVIAGWWATIVAGLVAGLVRGLLVNAFDHAPGDIAWQFFWSNTVTGAAFGIFAGWLSGLAVLLILRATGRPDIPEGPYGAAGAPWGVPRGQPVPAPPYPEPVPAQPYADPAGARPPYPGPGGPPPPAAPPPYPGPPPSMARPPEPAARPPEPAWPERPPPRPPVPPPPSTWTDDRPEDRVDDRAGERTDERAGERAGDDAGRNEDGRPGTGGWDSRWTDPRGEDPPRPPR